ncbi:hypothetical protein N752_00135 [Desulforamulus aquiferis]|nr:hypothetical protein [Desulforamulus aquiferis]RYD07022.1 hypothetical protein N752_00135 [Desulforamulus aquiferis]
MKKTLGAIATTIVLSGQLLFAPQVLAATMEEAVQSIKNEPAYKEVVDKLTATDKVNAAEVDSFVRQVVDSLSGKELTNQNILDAASSTLLENPKMTEAVLYSFSDSDIAKPKKEKSRTHLRHWGT